MTKLMVSLVMTVTVSFVCSGAVNRMDELTADVNPKVLVDYFVKQRLNKGFNPVCESCKLGFDIVKQVLGDANNISRSSVELALHVACKVVPPFVPFSKRVCKKLGPDLIDTIYNAIVHLDDGIEPEHLCQLLLLCPFRPSTTTTSEPTSTPVIPTDPLVTTTLSGSSTTTVEPVTAYFN